MALKGARLSFALKFENTFIAAYTGKILCGLVINGAFQDKCYFVIHHFQIVHFYTILIQLLKLTAAPKCDPVRIDLKEENCYWQVISKELDLIIFDTKLRFTVESLYNLIDSFCKVSFFSLPILQTEMLLLDTAARLEISEIIDLKDISKAITLIESLKQNPDKTFLVKIPTFKGALLLNHYCHFVLIYKKLRSICDIPLMEESFKDILEAI
jgi:hypothetical protein